MQYVTHCPDCGKIHIPFSLSDKCPKCGRIFDAEEQ